MQAYERLIKYAKIYTTSKSNSETTPSTERQFDLANILVEEMKEIISARILKGWNDTNPIK